MTYLNFIFGLGIFLFGMTELEHGIRKLSDARLRKWLRQSTGTSLGSVGTGILTTALLQSSSMVSLLVLAFASAGILPFVNAVGIILGANLGTTFTGWIVATFGFKLELESMALPLLGSAAFVFTFAGRKSRSHYGSLVAIGLGLLLLGLGIMKSSMEALPDSIDVTLLQGHPAVVYLVFGILITFLAQSSSAVMMLSLAALNGGVITLPEAAAVVIGADLGTTGTTILGSIAGSSVKRQLAFAHCMFNLIVDLAAFVFLLPLLGGLLDLLRIADPLYGLVAFHSVMNLLGLVVFVPFLPAFANWIEQFFIKKKGRDENLLAGVPTSVVEAAIIAMQETVRILVLQASRNALRIFSIDPDTLAVTGRSQFSSSPQRSTPLEQGHADFNRGYKTLKKQEGELLQYSLKVQAQPMQENEVMEIERLQQLTRAIIYANKSLKDIEQDLDELKNSLVPALAEMYRSHRAFHLDVYSQLIGILLAPQNANSTGNTIDVLSKINERHYAQSNKAVHHFANEVVEDMSLVSMALNVNREIRIACENMISSVDAVSERETLGLRVVDSTASTND